MSLAIKQPGHVMSWLIKLFYFKKTTSLTTSLTEKINIFLTIDQSSIGDHFNPNDPAPLYKRQLSHQFQHSITWITLKNPFYLISHIRFSLTPNV